MKITFKTFIPLSVILLLSINSFATPLSGTYTINSLLPTGGTNFISFNAAEDSLTANGVSGPVLFLVKQGTYTEQVSFSGVTGASASNTITFKADLTNTADAKIEYNGATSTADNYVVQLNGASHFVFDSLTISATTGSTYGKLVDYIGANSFITFKNNTLYGSRNLSSSDNFSIFFENSGASNVSGDLTFDNNTIYGGSNAFYINSTGTAHQSNFFIINNTVMYSSDYGVYSNESSNVQVIGNYFEDDTNRTSTLHSIYLTYSDSASDIRANTIKINSGSGHAYGIRLTYAFGTASNPVHIENNMINMYATATNKLQYGIAIENGYYQNIYNNSVFTNCSWTSYGRPLYLSASTAAGRGKINVVNNIFFNNQGTNAIYTTSGTDVYVDSLDYNVYYSTGTPFRYNNLNYTSLALMQAISGKDSHSLFGDPGFVSATDLHLIGTLASNVGDNSIGVTTDIDGQSRPMAPSTTVDIGADEYTTVACPPPSAIEAAYLEDDSVRITWINGVFDNSWIIEYGASGFAPGTGTTIISSVDTASITGLLASTCYDVYVKSVCTVSDTSLLIGPFNFCTPCAPYIAPYIEDFATMTATAVPTCWQQGKGILTNDSKIVFGASSWIADDFANNGTLSTGAARCVLGFTNIQDWLISPPVFIGNGTTPYQVEFDIAVTQDNSNLQPFAGAIALDDKVVVLISTDYGSTWSDANILRQWDTTDLPSHLGENFIYNLSGAGYTGVIQIAVYSQSTINNVRNNVSIDNFKIIQVPTCPAPTMLAHSSSTTTSISANWVNGASDVSWLMEYGPVGFTKGTGTIVPVATSGTGTISGLNTSSLYDIYLRSICTGADTSRFVGPLKAQTLCSPQSDFCEDFEVNVDSNNLPVCWSKFVFSTDVNSNTRSVFSSSQAYQGDYSIQMNNYTDASATMMLVSPELSNLTSGTHRVNFWAKEFGSGGTSSLWIGTISSAGVFSPIDTMVVATAYSNFKIDFSSYSGTDTRVAIVWQSGSTGDVVYIDEFCWEAVPSCEKVLSASVLNSGIDSSSLNLGWATDTSHSSYVIWYGSAGYVPGGTGRIGTETAIGNFKTINSLSPLTEYCFWIRSICNSGDSSLWEGPLCGKTACPGDFKLPYSQDYSTYVPDCWTEAQGRLGTTNTIFTSTTASGWASLPFAYTGINLGANLQIYGATTDEWLISPTIDFGVDPNTIKVVEFDYALTETSSSALGTFGPDDSVALVISYDDGITWSQANILGVWDTSSTIASGSNHFYLVLRNKTGKVKFGFYASSTVSNLYSRFHVDNFSVKDTITSGINENGISNNFKVYPNPNDGQFTLLNEGETEKFTVNIMDIQGRIIYSEIITFGSNQSKQINISNYSKGIYILQLANENKTEQHRIVVR